MKSLAPNHTASMGQSQDVNPGLTALKHQCLSTRIPQISRKANTTQEEGLREGRKSWERCVY